MKMWFPKSMLVRYMVSYAVIMAVLFIGVGIFMNTTYTNTIRKNTIDSNINRLDALRMQHEEKLRTLIMTANQIGVSYYISPFEMEKEPMKAYHLKQQLVPYSVTNDFCDQVYLVFHIDDYVYASSTTAPLKLFTEKLILYEHTAPRTLHALLRNTNSRVSILPAERIQNQLIGGGYQSVVTVFVPLITGDMHITGNVMFIIDDDTYQRMFWEAIYEPRSTYIFHGDKVLTAKRDLPLSDEAVLMALQDYQDTKVLDLATESGQYLLIAKRGLLHDMQYVTVIPQQALREMLSSAQVTFLLFLLALSIPCMLLTFFFARGHAMPIRALRKLVDASQNSENDIEAISSGIRALVQQNDALHTRLSEGAPIHKANFVASFAKGRFETRDAAIKKAHAVGLSIDMRFYMIALIDEGQGSGAEMDIDRIMQGSEQGQISGYGVQLVALEQYLFAVFADAEEALENWAYRLKSASGSSQIMVAISNVHQDFENATNAYLEASTAYDNRFVMGTANVLRFSDVSSAAQDIAPFAKVYLEGFQRALRARDEKALHERIDALFLYLKNTELSLFAFRIIYNSVIDALLGEHFKQGQANIDALQYYDVFTLSSCRSIDDLDDILRRLCQNILQGSHADAPPIHPLIGSIIAYMNEHFQDPMLSMSAIADTYGISAARLSLDFKETVRMSPSEYLLLLRMEQAKTLLATTDASAKDIGASVGYPDASGFIRRFKQYCAMTPVQYRKSVPRGESMCE